MATIPEIDVHGAKAMLDAESAEFLDIRDPHAFAVGHIPGARHLAQDSAPQIVRDLNRDRPVVVYCYHGNSSRTATAWLMQQGFSGVTSMAGGFEAWRQAYPGVHAASSDTRSVTREESPS